MRASDSGSLAARAHEHADAPHPLGLLRARRQRPRRRAADERDELAPPHSITSSARATKVGHVEAERLGGLQIDHELVPGRRLHRQVGRPLALEDAVDVAGRAPVLIDKIIPVGDQAAAVTK